jgi:hypothetical protein
MNSDSVAHGIPRSMPARTPSVRGFVTLVAVVALLLVGCDGAVTAPTSLAPDAPTDAPAVSAAPTADGLAAAIVGAWRPGPYPLRGAAAGLGAAEGACRAAEPAIGDAAIAVTDVRGQARVLLVVATDVAAWACLASTDASTAVVRQLDVPAEPIGDEKLDLVLYEVLGDEAGTARTVAVGRVGRAGIRVVASFDDESEVEAAKAGGWWSMWWPTDVDAATIAVQDRQSIAIDALAVPRD